jgi:hypothetical protein
MPETGLTDLTTFFEVRIQSERVQIDFGSKTEWFRWLEANPRYTWLRPAIEENKGEIGNIIRRHLPRT